MLVSRPGGRTNADGSHRCAARADEGAIGAAADVACLDVRSRTGRGRTCFRSHPVGVPPRRPGQTRHDDYAWRSWRGTQIRWADRDGWPPGPDDGAPTTEG